MLLIIGLIYVKYSVHDVKRDSGEKGLEIEHKDPTLVNIWKLFTDYFNFKDLTSILRVMAKKRSGNKRLLLWIGYSVVVFGYGPPSGNILKTSLFSY